MTLHEIRHFHLFCGLGGGAKGFNRGEARVGTMVGRFRCLGGIDVDPASVADFSRLVGITATCLDLFDRDQYRAWHGCEPPPDWREASPDDIRRAAGNERPNIVFTSPPCKGFSGLLSETRSRSDRYQALNRLTLRGIWLTLEAWADDPPEFFILENVPRILTRGRGLLDQIVALLQRYGYATAETTHDCGELGGLAQTRKRFLLVARHLEKVPPFLYCPDRRPLRAVGEVLERFPMPGAGAAGPMHRLPALQWRTWVRLAFVEAGKDWRSLNRLRIEDGHLADYLLVKDQRHDYLGVTPWDRASATVSGEGFPSNGRYSVADPRFAGAEYGQFGVLRSQDTAGAVTGGCAPGQGRYSIADPRSPWDDRRGVYRVVRFEESSPTVIAGGKGVQGGQLSVADPRYQAFGEHSGKMRVDDWMGSAHTITGSDRVGSGALSIADPRTGCSPRSGTYGVIPCDRTACAVTASGSVDNGAHAVADPRVGLPGPKDRLTAMIIAEDSTWHRPFTTLELAALQGLVDPEEHLELEGLSDSGWRERIGNAVPPPAAEAIAGVMGKTLLLAWSGETFALDSTPIWVRPIAVALSASRSMEDGK